MAATTYLASNPPPAGYPKIAIHKSALAGLEFVGAAIHDEAPVEPKKKATIKFTRSRTPSSEEEEHELPRLCHSPQRRSRNYEARSELTQRKIDKSRSKRVCSTESGDDNRELCGIRCFGRVVRLSRMPKNFKLPSDNPKFDGMQEPKTWLDDHMSSVKLHSRNKNTALQCLQLQLISAARV